MSRLALRCHHHPVSALRRTRLTTIAVVFGGAFLTWLEWQASPNAVPIVLAFDLAVGWSFIGAGLIARGVRIAPNVGSLWIAAGLAWFAGALISAGGTLYLGFVAHVLATFPTGRAARGIQRIVVAAGYVVA